MDKKTHIEIKQDIIESGYKAIEELKKVAESAILDGDDDDLSADRLKNAAQTKRICIEDAFAILERISQEQIHIESEINVGQQKKVDFAEQRARKN